MLKAEDSWVRIPAAKNVLKFGTLRFNRIFFKKEIDRIQGYLNYDDDFMRVTSHACSGQILLKSNKNKKIKKLLRL